MTQLYSKEIKHRAVSVLTTSQLNHPYATEQDKADTQAIIRLIENGNEVVEALATLEAILGVFPQRGHTGTVLRGLIKKIKGEG